MLGYNIVCEGAMHEYYDISAIILAYNYLKQRSCEEPECYIPNITHAICDGMNKLFAVLSFLVF